MCRRRSAASALTSQIARAVLGLRLTTASEYRPSVYTRVGLSAPALFIFNFVTAMFNVPVAAAAAAVDASRTRRVVTIREQSTRAAGYICCNREMLLDCGGVFREKDWIQWTQPTSDVHKLLFIDCIQSYSVRRIKAFRLRNHKKASPKRLTNFRNFRKLVKRLGLAFLSLRYRNFIQVSNRRHTYVGLCSVSYVFIVGVECYQ